MKSSKVLGLVGFFIASLNVVAQSADVPALRPIPGDEYDNSERELKIIAVADFVKDSPQWVYQQETINFIKRDWVEYAKYVSPALLKVAQANDESSMAAMTKIDPNQTLQIADFKEDGDSYYAYMGFQRTDKDSYQIDYVYFLKRDGHWIRVCRNEWQAGKLAAVHNYAQP
jgi:hypothetical protein